MTLEFHIPLYSVAFTFRHLLFLPDLSTDSSMNNGSVSRNSRIAHRHPLEYAIQSTPSSSPCSSPSPQSDIDSDDGFWIDEMELRSAIASTPESQLRDIVEKLVRGNSLIRRAFVRELRCRSTDTTPSSSPSRRRRKVLHKKRRSSERAHYFPCTASSPSCINCGRVFLNGWDGGLQKCLSDGPCAYHPGTLEVFEFSPTINTHGRPGHTMKMWTCCEGDPDTSGCIFANTHHVGSF
ncbi:hypothetical protein EV421DRAFT_483560 [Armillaria borealis]|uniref:Uncharacterized protein n=1 Tax=Armillaria borealis TaxID=47425 RepID=A0AA39MSB8_9AGAR|nr:hypothetical protein EV421DRAFT_483560 [Armillaria borealis]